MLSIKFSSGATILFLICFAFFVLVFKPKNEVIVTRSSCPINSLATDAYNDRHNFRRFNTLITDYDHYIAEKVMALAKRQAGANDSQLVQLAREMMDHPRPGVITKLSAGKARRTLQSTTVDELLNGHKFGKYIECGGYDGENASPTVFFEAYRGWTGLLVEPDPAYYTQLLGKQRNVYSINACLSPEPYFSVMTFQYSGGNLFGQVGRLASQQNNSTDLESENSRRSGRIPCFPIETLLLAINWTTVDFFSLDVEGVELPVLQTIPWDKFKIRTLSVEHKHGSEGKRGLINYMGSQNFKFEKTIKFVDNNTTTYIHDLVFSRL